MTSGPRLPARSPSPSAVRGDVWPWMIEEIDARVRSGHALPAAVLGVALHGPPALRPAASEAQRLWSTTGDAAAALQALQHHAADPRMDRLCETAVAVHTLDGDVAAVLERLRATALDDARRDRELGRRWAATRFAAWLALVPVGVVAFAGATTGVVAFVIGAAAAAWAMRAAGSRSGQVRVFGTQR